MRLEVAVDSGLVKNRKRLVIICGNADEAGAPRHVEDLALTLNSKWDLLCVFGAPGPVFERLKRAGVSVQILPGLGSKSGFGQSVKAIAKAISYLRSVSPDLVHCHSSKAGAVGRMAAGLLRIPAVFTVHGWGWRGFARPISWAISTFERMLSWIPKTHYIYVSRSVQNEARAILKIQESRGDVIYNWSGLVCDDSRLTGKYMAKGEVTIVMPARVCLAKDHKTLLKAFEIAGDGYRLILCGAGTNDYGFISWAKSLTPTSYKRIEFLGEINDMDKIFDKSDICVLSSAFEALPISLIEAMTFGLPIIASNVGGVSEIVEDGINGLLFQVGDSDSLLKCIHQMRSTITRAKYGSNGRFIAVSKFSRDAAIQALERVYIKCIR